MATMNRLEAVDRVVRRADVSQAVMEERVCTLEQERDKALDAAAAAQARVEELAKSQRRIEWQNKARTCCVQQVLTVRLVQTNDFVVLAVQMLDRLSEVQLAHNRQKAAAMQELLDENGADQGSTIADTDDLRQD